MCNSLSGHLAVTMQDESWVERHNHSVARVNPSNSDEAVEVPQVSRRKNACEPIEVLSAQPDWVELRIPCTREAAESIQIFLSTLDADLSTELRNTIGLALRELLFNAVEWGGKLDPNRKVRIAHIRSRRMLLYRITDPGPGFSFEGMHHAIIDDTGPEAIVEVTTAREALGMRPGGFGISMSRALADDVLYNEAQNEVVLIKYLPS
jgi:anti-sigma regulatory factor (Ser/Thr protein kinase)